MDVSIMPVSGEGGFTEAEVTDFSDHGLGLWVPHPPRGGEQIVVKVMLERTALLIYAVRRCEPDGAGFRVGAEFAGVITSPDFEDEDAVRAAFVTHLEAAAAQSEE